MSTKIHISRKLVKAAASAYTSDPIRVFLEYIDNSLDSAEDYFEHQNNSYNKAIKITMEIDRGRNSVKIQDNCRGIPDITKVVTTIGDSNKAQILEKNGQFGFGMFSFMAIAENLSIVSKYGSQTAKKINISEKIFSEGSDDEAIIDDPIDVDYIYNSGTEIIVSKIEKGILRKLNNGKIAEEISKHFEGLLSRGNLQIIVMDENEQISCTQFNYKEYDGDIFEDIIDFKSRGHENKSNVKIFLKITNDKQIDRPPFFIIKGRRIIDIKDDKDFAKTSAFKKEIWDHPYITGYIDLGNAIEPRLDRAGFKNNENSRLIFKEIANREGSIRDMLTKISRETENKHYRNLEDKLTSVLAGLAKQDRMNYRNANIKGTGDQIRGFKGPVVGIDGDMGFGSQDTNNNNNTNNNINYRKFGGGEGNGFGPNKNPGEIFPGEEITNDSPFKNLSDFGDELANLNKKTQSGFSIKFVDGDAPIDLSNNKVRSQIVGGEIRIFKEHPDFRNRVQVGKNGEDRITSRLITYLAGEITIHYKNEFYCKKGEQPEYNKQMFVELVEFIYKYEHELKDLVGKNLSDI